MRSVWGITLLVGISVSLSGPQDVYAQACKDEASMVDGSKQALVEFTDTVKKETLAGFESSNHQKSAVNKFALHDSMLGELISCLDKASQDTTLSKEDVAAAKTQHDASVKIEAKLKQQRDAVKEAKSPQDAKTLIANLDLAP
jgi:hypothetical protein